jgi:hypothetical protein
VTIKPWAKCLIIFAAWLVMAMVLSALPIKQTLRWPTDVSTPID